MLPSCYKFVESEQYKLIVSTKFMITYFYLIKVLQHIGTKQLTCHLRSFCDMLVCEFSKSGQAGHVNKCIDAMNNMIWKYNIVALEKLILCMALRTHEGSEAQVSSYFIKKVRSAKNIFIILLIFNISSSFISLYYQGLLLHHTITTIKTERVPM